MFNANSIDPDQTMHSAASNQGVHCLLIILFGVSRLKYFKVFILWVFFLSNYNFLIIFFFFFFSGTNFFSTLQVSSFFTYKH